MYSQQNEKGEMKMNKKYYTSKELDNLFEEKPEFADMVWIDAQFSEPGKFFLAPERFQRSVKRQRERQKRILAYREKKWKLNEKNLDDLLKNEWKNYGEKKYWVKVPDRVEKCGHTLEVKSVGGPWSECTCDICKFSYVVDSSN